MCNQAQKSSRGALSKREALDDIKWFMLLHSDLKSLHSPQIAAIQEINLYFGKIIRF